MELAGHFRRAHGVDRNVAGHDTAAARRSRGLAWQTGFLLADRRLDQTGAHERSLGFAGEESPADPAARSSAVFVPWSRIPGAAEAVPSKSSSRRRRIRFSRRGRMRAVRPAIPSPAIPTASTRKGFPGSSTRSGMGGAPRPPPLI